jgi:hypothetical protein
MLVQSLALTLVFTLASTAHAQFAEPPPGPHEPSEVIVVLITGYGWPIPADTVSVAGHGAVSMQFGDLSRTAQIAESEFDALLRDFSGVLFRTFPVSQMVPLRTRDGRISFGGIENTVLDMEPLSGWTSLRLHVGPWWKATVNEKDNPGAFRKIVDRIRGIPEVAKWNRDVSDRVREMKEKGEGR